MKKLNKSTSKHSTKTNHCNNMEQYFCNEWATNVFNMLESNPSVTNYNLAKYGAIVTQTKFNTKHNIGNFCADDIILNKNLTFEQKILWIMQYATPRNHFVENLCKSDFISYDYIFAHPEIAWNKTTISKNPNLTLKIILQKPTNYWDWDAISKHTTIPIKDIIANRGFPWNWANLSYNENISCEDVFGNVDLPWDWEIICESYAELHWITNNPTLPWDWGDMHNNENITLEFVENNIDKPWDWKELQNNPIITIDFMLKHKDKEWNWTCLKGSKGLEHQQQYMEHMMRKLMLATIYKQQTRNDKRVRNASRFYQGNVDYVFADEYIVSRIARY